MKNSVFLIISVFMLGVSCQALAAKTVGHLLLKNNSTVKLTAGPISKGYGNVDPGQTVRSAIICNGSNVSLNTHGFVTTNNTVSFNKNKIILGELNSNNNVVVGIESNGPLQIDRTCESPWKAVSGLISTGKGCKANFKSLCGTSTKNANIVINISN